MVVMSSTRRSHKECGRFGSEESRSARAPHPRRVDDSRIALRAYKEAEVTPSDIDVAEVHDRSRSMNSWPMKSSACARR